MQKILAAILVMCMAAGCTTTRSYHAIGAASAEQIEPGKTAIIEFVDGSSEKVEIRSYAAASVEVVAGNGTLRSIDYAEIRTIHAKELDKAKTAGAVIGGVLVLGLLALSSSGVPGFPSTAPAF